MPNYDFQVVLKGSTGLPRDVFVNTLHYSTGGFASLDDAASVMDGINGCYTLIREYLSSEITGMAIKVYEPGPNPGGPAYSKDYAFTGAGGPSPAELALCLSYASVDDPEGSTPRRRGRIYVGPLGTQYVGASRPGNGTRAAVLDFGAALAQVGTGADTTWMLYSRRDDTYAKIESIWVDDAWDVQRRRGLSPTFRQARDVQ
jgi:hypothetical protein